MTTETFYLDQAQYEAIRAHCKRRRYYKKQLPYTGLYNDYYKGAYNKGKETEHTLIEVPFTAYGDYVGSTVERANHESLVRDYGNMFVVLHGAYSYESLFYCPDCLTKAQMASIQDIVESLEGYPLYDEEHYSELEYILTIELLNDTWFMGDVYKALPDDYKPCDTEDNPLDYDELSKTQQAALQNIIMQAYEQGDIYATFENPFSAYIDEDDMANAIDKLHDKGKLFDKYGLHNRLVWFDALKGIEYPTSTLPDNKQDTMLFFIP